jgi:hypothetical protein
VADKAQRKARRSEKTLFQSREYARATILALAGRAESGDHRAVESLFGWLARYPDMRALVHELDDLASKVERCWVRRVGAPEELLSRKAVEDDLARMKAELLGPRPSVTERVLGATVVVAHLAFQSAALAAAQPAQPEVRAARERILTLAQKRLADAVKAWEAISARKAKGRSPHGALKLFEPTG